MTHILLQKKNKWEAFVYLSLVYDNNSTVKSIRKVLMSVMARHNKSKRDNVGHAANSTTYISSSFLSFFILSNRSLSVSVVDLVN